MRGGMIGPYLQRGEFQINGYWSRFSADETFRGYDVIATGSVLEGGDTLNLLGAYGLTRRVNLTAEVPYVLWSYWSNVVAGTRYYQHVHGFGDTVIGSRVWLLNPEKNSKQNIGVSLGLRLPWSESNYQVPYPNSKGNTIIDRPVYPAVQPGSGALGLRLSAQGFRSFKRFSVYGSGLYLFSLKKQNDTFFRRRNESFRPHSCGRKSPLYLHAGFLPFYRWPFCSGPALETVLAIRWRPDIRCAGI